MILHYLEVLKIIITIYMTQQEIQDEILKCKESPYYFATKYIKVKDAPYSEDMVDFYTPLSEEEFNKLFKKLENGITRNTR
jgi:hypothetical protein